MLLRAVLRIGRAASTDIHGTPSSPSSAICVHSRGYRDTRSPNTSANADPGPSSSTSPDSASDSEPSSSSDSYSSSSIPPPPPLGSEASSEGTPAIKTGLPTLHSSGASFRSSTYTSPPFHTHEFYKVLQKNFTDESARSLMRATRALLVDRVERVRREALTVKDLDNQAYLFRAALSELRAEMTMSTKNDSAAIRAATAALRKEVDKLDVKMKEDIQNLKHEIQMELDSRKNEGRADFKQQDIKIEEVMNKSVVHISDLRTDVEEIKWENMRKAVLTLAGVVIFIIVLMEAQPAKRPPPTPPRQEVIIPPEATQASDLTEPMT